MANLSRNVIVESADPAKARGHTMYHVGSSGAIHYAEFRHLGKEGVLGQDKNVSRFNGQRCEDIMRRQPI